LKSIVRRKRNFVIADREVFCLIREKKVVSVSHKILNYCPWHRNGQKGKRPDLVPGEKKWERGELQKRKM